jgi:hypothetical protein
MHESKYGIETLFHNHPRLLKTQGEKRDIDHFKEIMSEIIEQPLLINSELFNGLMFSRGAILHSMLKQKGLYNVMKNAFIHMEKCLQNKLITNDVEVYKVNSGVYSQEHIDNLQLNEKDKLIAQESILDPHIIADVLSDLIMDHNNKIYNHINIYQELEKDKYRKLTSGEPVKEPRFYQEIQ